MRKFTFSLTLSLGIALVGCATLAPLTPAPEAVSPQVLPAFEPGDLVLRLRMGDSRIVQTITGDPVAVYDANDVDKLVITGFVKVGDAFVPMNVSGKPTTENATDRLKLETTGDRRYFVLKNLPAEQTYGFQARAFDAQGKQISKDADSITPVTFVRHTYVETADIPLRLVDKPFVATAKAQLSFPDGLDQTDRVVVTLFKKGPLEVKVAGPFVIFAAELQNTRTLLLGGLAPETTYVLKAEARAANDEVLASASNEWKVENDRNLGTKTLALSFETQVTTISGGSDGFNVVNVPLAQARYIAPYGMTLGDDGAVYVADQYNSAIRRLDLNGNVTTWAGIPYPEAMTRDASGNLYATSGATFKVYKITGQDTYTTYAGNGSGSGLDALTNSLPGVCVDPQNQLYVTGWDTLWKYTAPGQRTTGSFGRLEGLHSDSQGNIYAGDVSRHIIIKIASESVAPVTVAGSGAGGIEDGPVLTAKLSRPRSLALSGDTLYFTDDGYIRQLKGGRVKTLAGGPANNGGTFRDGKGSEARFGMFLGGLVVLPDGNLVVSDMDNRRIRKIVLPNSPKN
ncbi:hypothetical protein J7643_07695 [bacterium]|nr:hypothetical protein [bacterium]